MKRWIGIALIVLLLTGCGVQDPAPSDHGTVPDPTPGQTAFPSDPAVTEPEPEPEPQPLTAWELDGEYTAAAAMGNDLLLTGDGIQLVLDGITGQVKASASIPGLPALGLGMQANAQGVAYFDAAGNCIVFLDSDLNESFRLTLEETPVGDVYLSRDWNSLYFCTAEGIRVWDADTGRSRALKVQEGSWLGISAAMPDESALRCALSAEDGSVRTLLISASSGETLWEGSELNAVTMYDDLYCYDTGDGCIFGWGEGQPCDLLVSGAVALPQMGAAITTEETESSRVWNYYDLASGLRTASVEMEGTEEVRFVTVFGERICLMGSETLYLWDLSLTAVEDETVYTAPRYTAEDPDEEGLQSCRDQADALEQQYGVKILMWTAAADAEPAGYTFETEYLTQPYEDGLAALETALGQFPAEVLAKAPSWAGDGKLRIVLVRSITTPAEGTYATLQGMQYLLDGNLYLVLALNDGLTQNFFHAFAHVIDPHVLSNSGAYDKWSGLNPSGFRYDNDYIKNLSRDGSQYAEYFIDTYSMSYAVEDRARILEYALTPGNEARFASKQMQAKLKAVCKGIREAFGLTGDSYLWEQYLN